MLIAALAVTAVVIPGAALAGSGHEAVTLCHKTGSAKNPGVVITVDADATKKGHQQGVPGHHQDGDAIGSADCSGDGGGTGGEGGEF
jgi:hypothetical protein